MTLDDLKNIDINNIAGWPLPVKIGGIAVVSVLLLVLGYFLVIADEITQYEGEQQKERGLKDTYSNKKALAINLPAYKQQMEEMRQAFGTLLRQLPNKTEVPNLLVDVTQAGLGRGLEFELFKPSPEQARDFYAEFPVSLKVAGTYHEIALFISDVSALPRIVTVSNITLESDGKTNKLKMSATAKTYRYLDASGVPTAAPGKPGAPAAPPAKK
jgi:type IV pilus assembly protein PilO